MNLRFDGATAVVTGAAHGFGRAIALAFAARGASVWACDVLDEELEETRRLFAPSGRLEKRVVDVTDKNAVNALVAEIEGRSVSVSILVNDAGGVLGQVGRPLEQVTPPEWQQIFDVNVTGAFYCHSGGVT